MTGNMFESYPKWLYGARRLETLIMSDTQGYTKGFKSTFLFKKQKSLLKPGLVGLKTLDLKNTLIPRFGR